MAELWWWWYESGMLPAVPASSGPTVPVHARAYSADYSEAYA